MLSVALHSVRLLLYRLASSPSPGSLVRFLPRLSSLLCLVHLAVPLLLPACSFISTEPTCTRTPSTCNASRMSPLLVRCFASCLACLFFCSVLPVHPAVPVAPSCSSFISTQPMPRTPSNPSRMSLLLSPLRNTKQNFSSPTTRPHFADEIALEAGPPCQLCGQPSALPGGGCEALGMGWLIDGLAGWLFSHLGQLFLQEKQPIRKKEQH